MAPDSEDLVLFAARLKNKEKEDFDTFLIDDNAEMSINKVFLENDLNSDDTDDTNSNNEDWEDFFPKNIQQKRPSSNNSESGDNDDNEVTSKSHSITYAMEKLIWIFNSQTYVPQQQ